MQREKKKEYVLAIEVSVSYLQIGIFDYFGKCFAHTRINSFPEVASNNIFEINPNDWLAALKEAMRILFARFYFRAEDIDSIVVTGEPGIVVPVDAKGDAIRNALINVQGKTNYLIEQIIKESSSFTDISKGKNWLKIVGSLPGSENQEAFSNFIYFKNRIEKVYIQTDKFLEAKDFISLKLGTGFFSTPDSCLSNHLIDLERHIYVDKYIQSSSLDRNKFPEIVSEAKTVGRLSQEAAEELGLISGVRIVTAPNLIHTNLLGAGSFKAGDTFLYLGNTAWITKSLGNKRVYNAQYSYSKLEGNYIAHSSYFAGINAIQFFYKNFLQNVNGLDSSYIDEFIELANLSKIGARKLFYYPFHTQKQFDKETFSGFFRTQYQHVQADFARAIFEGIVFFGRMKFEELQKYAQDSSNLVVGGIGAKSNIWCQLIADIFGRNVQCVETPGLLALKGAVFMSSMEKGRLNEEDILSLSSKTETFEPNLKVSEKYAYIFSQFKKIF